MPPELTAAFGGDAEAFESMARGKKREYVDHVAEAKRADTRLHRLDKIMPMIRAGQGLNDKYRP